MFNVITGPFQPTLESHLVQEIHQLKSSDPLTPIAIVVPSDALRHRLKWLLCVEQSCSLFDVHFLTFHQLARRLHHEQILGNQDNRVLQLELVDDLFFGHLLAFVMKEKTELIEGLRMSRYSSGTIQALWRTIRDLKEAMVDPELAIQGVREGLFGQNEGKKLEGLFSIYAVVQEISRKLKIGSPDDLASLMIPWVEYSEFLSRVQRVCYYGFYDLTQVQLSLFEGITAKCPVTVYFPLSEGTAFSFARHFFERHLSSGVRLESNPEDSPSSLSASPVQNGPRFVRVMHTVGPEDEVSVACKEMMLLVEHHHYTFDEIGLVFRNFEPYQSVLRRKFEQHQIPFTTSMTTPGIMEPLIKHLIQFSRLPLTDFYWRDVLDILSSPYYRLDRLGLARNDLHPEHWHLAVRALGIHRGKEQWSRLAMGVQVNPAEEMGFESPQSLNRRGSKDPILLENLHQLVSGLIADCQALPVQGTMRELTEAFLNLVGSHLVIPGLVHSPREWPRDVPDQSHLGEIIQHVTAVLRQMELVKRALTWEQWVQEFIRTVNSCGIPVGSSSHSGVQVLDAMSARGLPFRALFLVGLNEKVFPRFIREDAFLRDRSRRVLETTFGYKIDEKLTGYDEEQLLFALLTQATQQRLYLIYQRADAEGRPLAPSPYLADSTSPVLEGNQNPDIHVPRRMADKINHPLFQSSFLTSEEFGLKLIFQGFHPGSLLEKAGREPQLFQNGCEVLHKIERSSRELGRYDGMVGSVETYWRRVRERGLSPTALEDYARCPFQYFSRHVLRLESIRTPNVKELTPASFGKLCHEALRATYTNLIAQGWPETPLSTASIRGIISSTGTQVFDRFFQTGATGYFLIWQLAKNKILQLVHMVIEADQEDYRANGFRPIAFEVYSKGRVGDIESIPHPINIHGRLDRVDQRSQPPGIRIVDYKFTASSDMKRKHRDLLLSGIRGMYLQPPMYAMMNEFSDQTVTVAADEDAAQPEEVEFLFLAPAWKPQVQRSGFAGTSWQGSTGQQLKKTISTLVQGIQDGSYFILPDDYCRHCDFCTICRRTHRSTWMRSLGARQARQVLQIRTKDYHRD